MNGSLHNTILYFRQAFQGLKHIRNFRLSLIRKAFSLMGSKEKTALLLLAAIALANLFVSGRNLYHRATTPVPARGGTYVEGMLGQPAYINPLLATQEPDLSLIKLIHAGLYKYNSLGEVVPDLAEALPAISEDQKQYTVKLRRNAQWHNGSQLTADDVIFTFETLKSPDYKSPLRSLWMTTNVEKINDHTVKFTTKDVSGPFLDNLTLPIVSKLAWENEPPSAFTSSQKNLYAVGAGPYSIKKIKRFHQNGKIQEIEMSAFGGYYGEKAKIETVVFKFYDTQESLVNSLHSKEIEGFGSLATAAGDSSTPDTGNIAVYKTSLPQYQMVFFNTHGKVLGEQPVRRALAIATDKQKIIDAAHGGNALLPMWPIDSPAVSALPQNLEEAKKILDGAGWIVDPATGLRAKKGAVLELTISTNDYAPNAKTAEELARQWRELNIKVNVTVADARQLADSFIKPRTFDALIYSEKFNADPDPFAFWHSTQSKDPGLNLSGFENQQADKLITEARTNTNAEIREQKYKEFFRVLETEVPTIFLNQTQYTYATNPEIKNVSLGVLYDPSQRFYGLPSWYIAQKRVLK